MAFDITGPHAAAHPRLPLAPADPAPGPRVAPFLPLSMHEARTVRGWDELDVVFVTGDAYVDHPSFAMAVLGRLMEANGLRVGIVSQPSFRDATAFKEFGRPRLCFCVSAGNLDSMLNHYTAHKRPRRDDAYSPDAAPGRRPDKATVVYTQRCKEAFADVPVIVGGVEASMRRLGHYDYWSDTVKRSVLLDSKADLLVYGMGERPLLEILQRLQDGQHPRQMRNIRGTVYALGANETQALLGDAPQTPADHSRPLPGVHGFAAALELPAFDLIRTHLAAFARCQHDFHKEQNPANARVLVQRHGQRCVVQNPPQATSTTAEMDAIFALPFNKVPHPAYGQARIPAYETVRFSINIMRGCFGGCTFCAITEHQGKAVASRSQQSVLAEVAALTSVPGFTGVVSDLGGPTANMYQLSCGSPAVEAVCRRHSCVHPTICKHLKVDSGPVVELMKAARNVPGVRKVLIASGVRMDLADEPYINELAAHHVGGHLKVAPEHVDGETLARMKKPGVDVFVRFKERFDRASEDAGKQQYLVPYFVGSHPGCDRDGAIALAQFLKAGNFRPDQVQDFIPTPMTPATCMWFTGVDPLTMKAVSVEHTAAGRKQQRALMQYWKPENRSDVLDALRQAGREDLVGNHANALVPLHERKGWQPTRDKGKSHGRPKRHGHPNSPR